MRPSKDATWLEVARVISRQSTCLRRQVGCVLIDQHGQVLSTGWNGVASGQRHCNEETDQQRAGEPENGWLEPVYGNACPGATAASGTNLDGCYALHAEWNALLQCRDVQRIITCCCTTAPCVTCVKLLLNTSCRRIVYLEEYPGSEVPRTLWTRGNRTWEMLVIPG